MSKLIGSHYHLEGIKDLIERFYCGTVVNLIQKDGNTWTVSNSRGQIEGVRVTLIRKRYRFEAI